MDKQAFYQDWWKDQLEDSEGNLIKEKIMEVLWNYSKLEEEVSRVYFEITNGKISKPNTDSSAVICVYEDEMNSTFEELLKEQKIELNDERVQKLLNIMEEVSNELKNIRNELNSY